MTAIAWTDETWNPVRGCSMVSAGCENCYAMRQAHRFSGEGQPYEGLTRLTSSGPKWTGSVRLVPEVLDQPLRWRKPRRIFVNSMSDLFHEEVPEDYIAAVFARMAMVERHTFQILTKRPQRMEYILRDSDFWVQVGERCEYEATYVEKLSDGELMGFDAWWQGVWDRGHLRNVWLGVSCEDQAAADERIPLLLQTPAAVRFVSAEPLLGRLDLSALKVSDTCDNPPELRCDGPVMVNLEGTQEWCDCCVEGPELVERHTLDWVIVGGESGPGARPTDVGAVRSIVEQCREASVPVFCKQLGARPFLDVDDDESDTDVSSWFGGAPVDWDNNWEAWLPKLRSRKGDDPDEWPEDLRVQQYPEVRS